VAPGEHSHSVEQLDEDDIRHRVAAASTTPGTTIGALRRLEGGVSSMTFASALRAPDGSEEAVVVKVAPPGLAPVRNRDVLRQARALRRLERLDGFPVPRVVLEDDGVPPLFAMELRRGDSYEPLLDVAPAPPAPQVAATRFRAAARTLARLHSESPAELGFGDEPVTSVADELDRWRQLFATVDADIAPGHERLHERLLRRVPPAVSPALLHGDYRCANMLFVGDALEAVIDWEIWSVGDPRFDLAWLLMHTAPAHTFHAERPPADVAAGSALPSAGEVLDEYAAARRADGADDAAIVSATADLDWFLAVCLYKTASTIAVIHKRDRKRPDPDASITLAGRRLDEVLAAGHVALDGGWPVRPA
jgi:aminoglycoside phosphotransferase (APT) family kinase protein